MPAPPAPRKSRPPVSRLEGLTLLQLIVVVTIIGLLTTFLIVGRSSTPPLAGKVSCGANLNQIYKAMHLYVSTFGRNSQYPHLMPDFFRCLDGTCPQAHSQSARTHAILKGSDEIFTCPSAEDRRPAIMYRGPTVHVRPDGAQVNYITDQNWGPLFPVACDVKDNHRDGGNVLRFDSSVRWVEGAEYDDVLKHTAK